MWDSWSNKQNQNNQSVNSTSIAFSPQGNLVTSGNQLVLRDFTVTGNVVGTARGSTMSFIRIGHSFLALIAAISGGLLSRHLNAGNRESAGTAHPREHT